MKVLNRARQLAEKLFTSQKIVSAASGRCIVGKESQIHKGAKITNQTGNPSAISIGTGSHIFGTLLVWNNAGIIRIGNHTFIGEGSRLMSACSITIGDRVQIAHSCTIIDNNVHSLHPTERHKEFLQYMKSGPLIMHDLRESPVILENDVWLGACVIVLRGVKIGAGSIIGAGSVVTKSIPENSLAVGNPARIVRRL